VPKFSLLVLDAGVVIKLFELRLWDQVVKQCDVHLSKVVAEQEVQFHSPTDADPHGQPIDLSGDIAESRVQVFECSLSQVVSFKNRFDQNYAQDLDPGELESLAWLFSHQQDCRICSGDAIVYRVLGVTGREDQGVSLQEILDRIGHSKNLAWQYTKEFREQKSKAGSVDRLQDRGLH
jgi:hypothetical protein